MALSIIDIATASFDTIAADARKPNNQWTSNGILRAFERKGFVKRTPGGNQIQAPLDYAENATAKVHSTMFDDVGLTKTSVLGSAVYDWRLVTAQAVYGDADEIQNPSTNQKIAYVTSVVRNALDSHDAQIEKAVADTTVNGLLGLRSVITEAGTGTIGGIVSGTDTMWLNVFSEYTDATDLEAHLAAVYYKAAKSSGDGGSPTLVVTNPTSFGLYEGNLIANERYVNAQEAAAGFRVLGFKDAEMIFSQYVDATDEAFYFLSPKAIQLYVASDGFRKKSPVMPLENKPGYAQRVTSLVQLVPKVRSRLGIAFS